LVLVSTQIVPHAVMLVGHAHCPATQILPVLQALPHEPQFNTSVWRFRHTPLHGVWPVGHIVTQIPAIQACPEEQEVPQLPQLLKSVCVLTQLGPHAVVPVGQTHDPVTHAAPVGQAWLQAAQCDGLVLVLTQVPLQQVVPTTQQVTASQASEFAGH
jgi:hypothetical protein